MFPGALQAFLVRERIKACIYSGLCRSAIRGCLQKECHDERPSFSEALGYINNFGFDLNDIQELQQVAIPSSQLLLE